MENKHWLIVYDIRNVKRLVKVEKCIQSYAWRVQNSVYESTAPEQTISHLKYRLAKIIETEEDFVLFFQICEKDLLKQQKFGKGADIKEQIADDGFAVL